MTPVIRVVSHKLSTLSISVYMWFPKISFAKYAYDSGIVFVVLFDIHSRTRLGGNWIAEVCGTVGTWNDGGCSGGGAVVVGDRRLSNVLYLDLCKIRGSLTGDYLCGTCFILFIIIFLSFFLNIFIFISIKKCGVCTVNLKVLRCL